MNCPVVTCEPAKPLLHHVEAGQGETVLLLHGSASALAFWRQTAQVLQPLHRVVAPDLIGYGRSPAWPADVPYGIEAEIHALQSLLPCCAAKYHLVGHSYGGVVALMLALASPSRVLTLTLIEPVFFAALRHPSDEAALRQFVDVRDAFLSTLARGNVEAAMRDFVGFWTGEGSWERMPAEMRAVLLEKAGKIELDWRASFAAEADLHALADLGPRTLLLSGDGSPAPMLRLVEALHGLMPGSARTVVPGAGHLMPVTHAAAVTQAMLGHFHADAERTRY